MSTLRDLWHLYLSLWVDDPFAASRTHPTPLGRLKEAVLSQGVNSRGWRLYLDYGDAIFDQLGRPWIVVGHDSQSNKISALAFLRLLQACEMDVLPPTELLRSMSFWGIPDNRLDLIPPAFFRAAWKMSIVGQYTSANVETFVETRIVPVCRWFFATRQYLETDQSQLKAGWALLERRCHEFLAARQYDEVQQTSEATSSQEWLTPVLHAEFDDLLFTALSSEATLQAEGESMAHCIGGYATRCRNSALRVYSVTHCQTRQRLATLTVLYSRESQGWQFDDMKGHKNAAVGDELIAAAFGLLHCLDDATNSNPLVHQALNRWERYQSRNLTSQPEWDDCCLPF